MNTQPKNVGELKQIAQECRADIIKMLEKSASGHPGGSLSAIDMIVALFFHEMKCDAKDPLNEDRDRFILSKGHGVPALYTVLAKKGYIERNELWTLRMVNSRLQGHPDRAVLPIVEASTGSLGQGLSIAQGVAMGLKAQKKTARVFCMIGDGESQEGQIWEALMSAPKFKLNNLVVLMDNNKLQLDGKVEDILDIRPVLDKCQAFGWSTQEIDGNNMGAVLGALEKARTETDRPSFILAHTIKGRGVSFMEGNVAWHGLAPTKEQAEQALEEIAKGLK